MMMGLEGVQRQESLLLLWWCTVWRAEEGGEALGPSLGLGGVGMEAVFRGGGGRGVVVFLCGLSLLGEGATLGSFSVPRSLFSTGLVVVEGPGVEEGAGALLYEGPWGSFAGGGEFSEGGGVLRGWIGAGGCRRVGMRFQAFSVRAGNMSVPRERVACVQASVHSGQVKARVVRCIRPRVSWSWSW